MFVQQARDKPLRFLDGLSADPGIDDRTSAKLPGHFGDAIADNDNRLRRIGEGGAYHKFAHAVVIVDQARQRVSSPQPRAYGWSAQSNGLRAPLAVRLSGNQDCWVGQELETGKIR